MECSSFGVKRSLPICTMPWSRAITTRVSLRALHPILMPPAIFATRAAAWAGCARSGDRAKPCLSFTGGGVVKKKRDSVCCPVRFTAKSVLRLTVYSTDSNSLLTPASLMQTQTSSMAVFSSSYVGYVGASRILESSGSFP